MSPPQRSTSRACSFQALPWRQERKAEIDYTFDEIVAFAMAAPADWEFAERALQLGQKRVEKEAIPPHCKQWGILA